VVVTLGKLIKFYNTNTTCYNKIWK
jgi:hypothetical protein